MSLKLKSPKFLELVLLANEVRPIPIEGNYLYMSEADYEIHCSLDNDEFFPMELANGIEGFNGGIFQSVKLKNMAAVANKFRLIYATNCRYIDKRQNVIERRNGSAASFVPGGLIEVPPLLMDGTPQMLVDYDANHAERWLWTDGLAYWGPDNTVSAAPFCQIGASLDGFTKIPTKAPIWVIGDPGVNVGARVISF
ncbi:MAG: hypothetical protein WC661_10240 [Opitutaceae bacterium]|jgi:hypothetical protein